MPPPVMNILHHQPLCNPHLTFISASPPLLGRSFLFSLFVFSSPSLHWYSAPSFAPCYSPSLHLSNQPTALFSGSSGLFSHSCNSAAIYLLFTHSPFHFPSALPISLSTLFCLPLPIKFVFPQQVHPCASVSPACFPLIFTTLSCRHQRKPESKCIIYQVALKFKVLKRSIWLAACILSLVWVLRAKEMGLKIFGLGTHSEE